MSLSPWLCRELYEAQQWRQMVLLPSALKGCRPSLFFIFCGMVSGNLRLEALRQNNPRSHQLEENLIGGLAWDALANLVSSRRRPLEGEGLGSRQDEPEAGSKMQESRRCGFTLSMFVLLEGEVF